MMNRLNVYRYDRIRKTYFIDRISGSPLAQGAKDVFVLRISVRMNAFW